MNKNKFKFIYRTAGILLLTSIVTFAFVWTKSSASQQADGEIQAQKTAAQTTDQKPSAEFTANAEQDALETITLKTEKRGFPLLNLQDGKKLKTRFIGDEQSFAASSAQPLAMINADLNADGAADLIAGYAGAGGARLAIYSGNPDSLSARTPEAFENIKQGRFPAPFLSKAQLISVPSAPDFVGAGDFNRDGYIDIIAATRGGDSLMLLAGDDQGGFWMHPVALPGRVTALIAENINLSDGQADVAVALSNENGAQLFVFDDSHDAFAEQPKMYSLPAQATSLAVGQLDDAAPLDILATAGGKAVIIHGSYTAKAESAESAAAANVNQVEALSVGINAVAARIGHFVWDRANQPEIALLSESGEIQILQRGKLDTRQYTEDEWEKHLTTQEQADQAELMRRSADSSNRAANNSTYKKWRRDTNQPWTQADSFQLSGGVDFAAQSLAAVFTSARMTTQGVDNLIIADAANRKVKVLLQNNETLKAAGDSYALSATGALAAVEFDAAAAPAAILPMRLSVMTRPGLVMLDQETAEISYAIAAPVATYNVTKTADTFDGTCDADCSLREAVRAANQSVNTPDIVNVPAGTYTLTIGPSDDAASGFGPAYENAGDLDVRDDITITGAGQSTTVIQAGTAPSNGIDRVMQTRQRSLGIPDLSITGVTIRNGKCVTSNSSTAGSARCNTGGAGILHSVDDLGAVTISDSTIASNWNVADLNQPIYLNGAGIFVGRGDTALTNVTFSNNENGATGSVRGGDGGAMLFGFGSATNTNTVTLTNCTVTGNIARLIPGDTLGGLGGGFNGAYDVTTITGGTFSNNSADLDGGGIYNLTATTLSNNLAVTSNTAKRDGGGIWSDPLNVDGTPATNSLTNITVRGNTADSDGTTNLAGDPRGAGGGIYHDRGTLNLSNVTIGGTTAGQPNTSYDGGGLGHRYRAQASTNNVSTITINGGSIVGNVANNDGGGIYHDAARTAGNNSTLSFAPATVVTLTNNQARNNGGGVVNSGGATATLNNTTLRSNQANSDSAGGGDGGALYQNAGTTTFTGTLIIGGSGFANSAVNGGGIRNNAGTITIPASASLTYNTASGTGGGISNAGTLSALATPTITNNTASGNGGGIFNSGTIGALTTPTLNNNTGSAGGGIFNSNGSLSITNGSVAGNNSGSGGAVEHSGNSSSTITSVSIINNTGSGIRITGTGSLDAKTNTITNNSLDGIAQVGTGTGSHFDSNIIHSNNALGIDLGDNGVTANDTNDTDTGPNNLQNFPVINYVKRGDSTGNLTLNAPNGRYRIHYYANTTCDSSGNGEGEAFLTTQDVVITTGNTLTFTSPALNYGAREQITATATSDPNNNSDFNDDGSTSEFSVCRKVNTLPTIAAQAGVTRQQGSLISNSQIATVTDPDQPLDTLAMTVRAVGGAAPGTGTATVNGVTISNIAVSAAGAVTADIVAACGATNANFTLRVTDNATEFNETTLSVTVTNNTAPTVGNYAATTVNAGSNAMVTPDAPPTDNGTIASVTATASAGFTGTFSTNTTTGAVTINNAAPAGTYTITVTTTDNCSVATIKTFTLTVNAIPTITAQNGISRQSGSPSANSPIAIVSDADQNEETLIVTVRAVGGAAPGTGTATVNGVTISNIAVSAAGAVTADIVAACGATNANFTLRVTDANGASAETTLTITVTANTAPTVGTYTNTTLAPGGGAVVTPSAAPTDNGTIASITATASAGFTGTLTTDAATGAVTVANANPVGVYTISVTVTDNCSVPTARQFALTVTDPPTITAATGITRGQGGLSSVSQIAMVSDANQAANTLTVTVNGNASATVNGVTVSGISIDAAGNVTANIIAAAGATSATFTLRVTDAQGAFAEATLSVTVVVGGYEADVAPRPNGTGNGTVNPGDVTQIQRFAVGLDKPYQSNEFQRADCAPRFAPDNTTLVLGNGTVNPGDVTQAQRYAVGLDPVTAAGGATASPDSLFDSETNGAQSTGEMLAAPETIQTTYEVSAVKQSATATVLTLAIQLQTGASKTGATSVGGTLRFTPSAVNSPTNIRLGAGAPAGTTFLVNDTDTANGRLGFTINAPVNAPIPVGFQQLLLIDFTIAGTGATAFTFDDSQAPRFIGDATGNEIPTATFPATTVALSPTAASAAISGRVMTASSRALGQSFVTLTNSNGEQQTTMSNPFGYFRFVGVPIGDYVISVQRKSYTFAPRALSVQDNVSELLITAEP